MYIMKKIISILLTTLLCLSFCITPLTTNGFVDTSLNALVNQTAAYILKTVKNPQVDSVGGEWAILGLARSGFSVPDAYYEAYYTAVSDYTVKCGGVLDERKYTEYSRITLALTAAGYDPRNVAGYDLTAPLADFDKTVWQGINGPIFALLALDSDNYPSVLRDAYISKILQLQLAGGGFNLTGTTSGADPDLTGMALQSLAKYQDKSDVKIATDKALDCLSALQDSNGGYSSWGTTNVESTVQVIVALCELNISITDPRFVKEGKTLLDNLLSFKNADGSFNHDLNGSGNNQMSTEQAFYALVALQRAQQSQSNEYSLYRMSDAVARYEKEVVKQNKPGLINKHTDVSVMPVILFDKTFGDIENHKNKAAIEELTSRNIINGKSDNAFDPDSTMTRAEFAAIITRGLGLEAQAVNVFTDVDSGAWYAGYIGTAYTYGIVLGISKSEFNPSGTITRQEAAVMTARAAKLCGMNTTLDSVSVQNMLAQFGDYISAADWARESLAFCYDAKILSQEDFDIQSRIAIKRCEIAQMLFNLLNMSNLLSDV